MDDSVLIVPTTLAKDLSLVLNTLFGWLTATCISIIWKSEALFWSLLAPAHT